MKVIRVEEWRALPSLALTWMKWLGDFGPTYDGTLKGYKLGTDGECGKAYVDSGELRELAQACIAVADWLDALPDDEVKNDPT